MTLTDRQKEILRHTLGIKQNCGTPFRNHFVSFEGHRDGPELDALVQAGYMTVRDAPRSSGWLYQATDKGREALGISK